jgi:hypothetical protein
MRKLSVTADLRCILFLGDALYRRFGRRLSELLVGERSW